MKRSIQALMFCSFGFYLLSIVPVVEAQEGQGDSWSDLTSRLAEVFGAQENEAAAQGEEEGAESNVTPSHVFQATLDLMAEIAILRDEMAIDDYPSEAELQDRRAPVHAYAKTLEVLGKVARVQRKLGVVPAAPSQIPVKEIVPADVLSAVQSITEEVRRIKSQLVIETQIDPAPFVGGKTPTLVYKNLGDASFLLDGLIGRPLTPNDVYGNVMQIHDDLSLIAAKLGASLELDPARSGGEKASPGGRPANAPGLLQSRWPADQAGYGFIQRAESDAGPGHPVGGL